MSKLMVSVSGVRGVVGESLTPEIIVKYIRAYADYCGRGKIVVGRDSRISGEMVKSLVLGTLTAKGNDIIDIGICPTPTVLFNTRQMNACGGIAISASHNPNEWNALKLLNRNGEFMSPEEHKDFLMHLESGSAYQSWQSIGKVETFDNGINAHIKAVLNLPFLEIEKIKTRRFRVLLDCVNGAGAFMMPHFLNMFGCEVIELNCERNGIFPRLPEPLPENLIDTMAAVKNNKADFGIVVDPDVDRLVLITQEGNPFGEEYTIAQAVKFILSKKKGNVVVNLSTTRAVDDIAEEKNCKVFKAAVGEAHVVKKMKEVNAVIGGEGSGGVILPSLQYGRDALTATAITLQHLLEFGGTLSELKKTLPQYSIAKTKIDLQNLELEKIYDILERKFKEEVINKTDGLRVDFKDHWVHFRGSNTEPILRIAVETESQLKAEKLIDLYREMISGI